METVENGNNRELKLKKRKLRKIEIKLKGSCGWKFWKMKISENGNFRKWKLKKMKIMEDGTCG